MIFKSLISLIKSHLLGASLLVLLPSTGFADPVGLLALYETGAASPPAAALADLGSNGCSIRREGEVSDASGTLEMPPANRFVLLECRVSRLATTEGRAALRLFARAVEGVVWMEGGFSEKRGLEFAAAPARAYLLKLSRYNNGDPDGRDGDVAAINRDASTRENGYRNEAVIAVSRAWGIATPDEVTLLFYDSSAAGKAFRDANGDLLKRIGAYNKTHLVDYVYLNASTEPIPNSTVPQ